jgi:hypothetical protein
MSGSGYLHWSNDPFEKMVIFPPGPLAAELPEVTLEDDLVDHQVVVDEEPDF